MPPEPERYVPVPLDAKGEPVTRYTRVIGGEVCAFPSSTSSPFPDAEDSRANA